MEFNYEKSLNQIPQVKGRKWQFLSKVVVSLKLCLKEDQPEIDLPLEREGGSHIRKEMSRNSPSVIHT